MLNILFLLLVAGSCIGVKRYDGYEVLRVDVKKDGDVRILKGLLDMDETVVDFWDFPRDVMVSPSSQKQIKDLLRTNNIQYHTWISNVQDLIDNQFSPRRQGQVEEFDYSVYHTYEEIQQWVFDTADRFPDRAKHFLVTNSYEGRELNALQVGTDSETPKEAIWIQGGIHAREWISPATVMWMTNQLLEDYLTDEEVRAMLDQYDIYVLPVFNTDGYSHTLEGDRLWRKTRSPNEGSPCIGTDANRNWDVMWGEEGASSNPCASTYHGDSAHSEPEVKGAVAFIEQASLQQTFRMFIDMHSYSQFWLNPYGYQPEWCVDHGTQIALANDGAAAIGLVYGTSYLVDTFYALLYAGSGTAQDWGYDKAGITYSYTIELRDTGEYGFVLPEDQIVPTSEETYQGLKAAIRYLMNNP
ncbi:carboxypeptidase B-like [Glandiceps talaboti]